MQSRQDDKGCEDLPLRHSFRPLFLHRRRGNVPRPLLLSTRNLDKRREIAELLGGETELHHPDEFFDHDIEETGETLWENALLKAREGFAQSGLPTVADDTGLEVDALDGRPGVYSSRYAGSEATYADNVRKLLQETAGVPEDGRGARFRTVAAYVDGERELRFDGVLEGTILTEARGEDGFGYDPVFLPEGESRTLAEMGLEEKNRISHRARAFQAFSGWWLEQR
ncbi:RdgB/HAM1 family non-canonical purine NTP pyrophosphatase [bacterium]|nr:RdgB/HAM1 family non-canonical purine NTP pyrophosphatase [bacterium]